MVEYSDYKKISVADMPGIIEGAHENKGLGHKFLKHIERTKLLCFVLDMSEKDPLHEYEILKNELRFYNPSLLERPSIVIANKMDKEQSQNNLQLFLNKYKDLLVVPISAKYKQNLDLFKQYLRKLILDKT